MTIWNDNAALAATQREQHATAQTNLRLVDYAEDLAAVRLMAKSGIDSNVVRFVVQLVTENAAAELVRLERFAGGAA